MVNGYGSMIARARSLSTESTVLCQPGEVFGRYEILFPIASGGMATVYAARVRGEGRFQKPVAVKLMLPHLARDEHFCTMFMDEATLAANIQSPYVVGTLDLGREGEVLYMAMDLVLGATLRDLQDSERFPPEVAAAIIAQTARGLHDAHQARSATGHLLRIVHRDVSPHNILVGVDGRARLSDFGVARALHRHSHTATGEFKGKLAYFSPEQLEAREDLDHRSDIFALGIVAWETFAGSRLFTASNPLALAKQIATEPIPSLDERVGLPTEIAKVVAKALARDRNERFASAEAFAIELERAASASVGLASPADVGETVRLHGGERVSSLERRVQRLMLESSGFQVTSPFAAVESPSLPRASRSTDDRPAGKRKAWVFVGAAAAALLLFALGLAYTIDEPNVNGAVLAPPITTEVAAPSETEREPAPTPEASEVAPVVEEASPDVPSTTEPNTRQPTPRKLAGSRRPRETSTSPAAAPNAAPSMDRGDARTSTMSVLRVGLDRFETSLRENDDER